MELPDFDHIDLVSMIEYLLGRKMACDDNAIRKEEVIALLQHSVVWGVSKLTRGISMSIKSARYGRSKGLVTFLGNLSVI